MNDCVDNIPIPGGMLQKRPLHFFWVCDCSGSMALDGKIQALNMAIREAIPHLKETSNENPSSSIFMRVLKFSHGAEWHVKNPIPVSDFLWRDLEADPIVKNANLDIIFMIDTSGSMMNEIETVKKNCVDFADKIISSGAQVRLGLAGFAIGGHKYEKAKNYKVHNLMKYTVGIWKLTDPADFKKNIQTLELKLFGGKGCNIANPDTVDMFPVIAKEFGSDNDNKKILVIISDGIGSETGINKITDCLKNANIQAHVVGVPEKPKTDAHRIIAEKTGGRFWDIQKTPKTLDGKSIKQTNLELKSGKDFSYLLDEVADTIANEVKMQLADGTVSSGTDMGAAFMALADELKMPPMTERGMPPVIVLVTDGKPTDDFEKGLTEMMNQKWAQKATRLAIAIGYEPDENVMKKFINNVEVPVCKAHNADALAHYVRWVSTVVRSVSMPASRTPGANNSTSNVQIPLLIKPEGINFENIDW